MASSKEEMNSEIEAEIFKIKDNKFDIKAHFHALLPMLLAKDQHKQENILVVSNLVNENGLPEELQKNYLGKDYVVMFYAHRPHGSMKSPFYQDEPSAHTSVLLCKVDDSGKIQKTLNIDSYNFTGYVDIMGERFGERPNPHIQNRLVLKALPNSKSITEEPLQQPSWKNMNCMFYSFTIVEQLLNLFKTQPDTLNNVLDSTSNPNLDPVYSKWLLQEAILNGMVGIYLKKSVNGIYVVDNGLMIAHHNQARENLATKFRLMHTTVEAMDNVVIENGVGPPIIHTKLQNDGLGWMHFALQHQSLLLSATAGLLVGLVVVATISTLGVAPVIATATGLTATAATYGAAATMGALASAATFFAIPSSLSAYVASQNQDDEQGELDAKVVSAAV